jgi:tetratricopeptide (TPR) repeat protein
MAVIGALAALTAIAYSNSFASGFILDNKGLLLDPRIREAAADNVALIFQQSYWWPTGEAGLYRPLTTLSYMFNYAILGNRDQPAGYHTVNLLLHVGNVLLAWLLARKLTRDFWPPIFVAAIWAVHPVTTESVTNIVGRADLLAAMAVLSGLLMYLESREATGRRRAGWIAGVAFATTAGVFSKESAIAIVPLIVLFEWTRGFSRPRALLLGCAATIPPIAAMLLARAAVLARSAPAEFPFTDNPIVGANWWAGRLTAIGVMARYLRLVFWPSILSCDYSYGEIPIAKGTLADWFAFLIVLAAAILVVLLFRWNRTWFFFACFAFINFLPASNLLFPIGTIMADRLLYLPSLGLLACAVFAGYAVAPNPKILAAVLCVIVTGFAVRTWMRNQEWQSELAIAAADVQTSPNSFKLHRLLASSLFDSDRTHVNIDRVIDEQEKALQVLERLAPQLAPPDVYRTAGYYYLVKARQNGQRKDDPLYKKATAALLQSVAIGRAADRQALLLLSISYLESGDPQKALQPIEAARDLDPLNPQVFRQLSAVYFDLGERAKSQVFQAIEDSLVALESGKWQQAAGLSDRVLELSRDGSDLRTVYFVDAAANLRLGKLDRAEKSARQAIQLDGARRIPKSGLLLAMILTQRGQFKEASPLFKAYLEAEPASPETPAVRRQLAELAGN